MSWTFPAGIMIDSPSTRDRDDAVWVEPEGAGWNVTVHIALVADAIPADGDLDRALLRRPWTVYRPDRIIPMLPPALGAVRTLHPHRPRDTVAVDFHVAPDGTVSRAHVTRGRLTRPHATDYATATAAMDDAAHPLHRVLRHARDAAHALLARRRGRGALVLYDLMRGWANDGDTGLRPLASSERHTAYLVVSECMVAANTAVAEFAVTAGIPIPFRNHLPAPTAPPAERLLEELRLAVDAEQWRRDNAHRRLDHLLLPAFYAPHATEHYGLRLPWYCHSTSPLRRYADVLVQRQLLAVLDDRTPAHTTTDLAERSEAINTLLHQARQRRRERHARTETQRDQALLHAGGFEALPPEEFHKVLVLCVESGRHRDDVERELLRRLDAGSIHVRDARPILLDTADPRWGSAREALARWLLDRSADAQMLLNLHVQARGLDAPRWEQHAVAGSHPPQFVARVGLLVDVTTRWSATCSASSKTAARGEAALSLLAELTGIALLGSRATGPDTGPDSGPPPGVEPGDPDAVVARDPVTALNEYLHARRVSDLYYDFDAVGPAHRPTFTCTARCRHTRTGTALDAQGSGATKAAAKAEAARALLDALAADPARA